MQAIQDPSSLVRQRYILQVVLNRARCVLHRRWLKAGRMDRRYARSRWVCVNSAVRLLQIQFELDTETQPGGRLFDERWKFARCTPDFLLGSMILCLELFYMRNSTGESELEAVISTSQILDILRISRKIWQNSHQESGDASRAFKIISRMMSISAGGSLTASSDEDDMRPPDYVAPQMSGMPPFAIC